MEITGKLIKILPEVSGESARGPWVKGGFVIETEGEYPRQCAFMMFGADKLAMLKNLPMGSSVLVKFHPESREFNDRWYTDLRCWDVQPAGQAAPTQAWTPQAPAAAPAAPAADNTAFAAAPQSPEDDLPF